MIEKKKRKISPLLLSLVGITVLVLFILFWMNKKNTAQQGEKIVTVALNEARASSPSDLADASLQLDGDNQSLTIPESSIDLTVGVTALTLGAPPEKIESSVSDHADDNVLLHDDQVASVSISNGVVRFYFALDKANVADGSRNALDKLINEAKGKRYLVIAPFYEEAEKNLVDQDLLKQRALNIWKVVEDAGVSSQKRIILKPQAQVPGDDEYASGTHIDVFTVQGDHYPTEALWSISSSGK